jgi:hypothetical protein
MNATMKPQDNEEEPTSSNRSGNRTAQPSWWHWWGERRRRSSPAIYESTYITENTTHYCGSTTITIDHSPTMKMNEHRNLQWQRNTSSEQREACSYIANNCGRWRRSK